MRSHLMHLTNDEIELLFFARAGSTAVEGAMEPVSPELSEAREHWASCQTCQELVRRHQSATARITGLSRTAAAKAGSDCPSGEVWDDIAQGRPKQQKAEEQLQHASQCAHCGPLLRRALADSADTLTPEQEAMLLKLESTKPGWQARMARELSAACRPERRWSRLFQFPRLVYAGGLAAVLVVAGMLGYQQWVADDLDRLLAQATVDIRDSGVVTRGSNEDAAAEIPPSLKDADAKVSRCLELDHENSSCLQRRARIDIILKIHLDDTVKTLRVLLEQQPKDVSIRNDLAWAYLARGDRPGHERDYFDALELLGPVARAEPRNAPVWFNYAVALEKCADLQLAADAWKHYLEIAGNSQWAGEARVNLERVQKALDKKRERSSAPLLPPAEFASRIESGNPEEAAELDLHIERYLAEAEADWLPAAYARAPGGSSTAGDAQRGLRALAFLLKQNHDDTWLTDLLRMKPSVDAATATANLAAADRAYLANLFPQEVELAQQAAAAFHRAGSEPGRLRASFAVMYARFFESEEVGCLASGQSIEPVLKSSRYRWLQVQEMLEKSECMETSSGELPRAQMLQTQALELARRSTYPGLQLRALAFHANVLSARDPAGALRAARQAALLFWQSEAGERRGQNLYTVLGGVTRLMDLHYASALAQSEMLADFPGHGPVDIATTYYAIADEQQLAGDSAAAEESLRKADAQIALVPLTQQDANRHAELAEERAADELRFGHSSAALAELEAMRPDTDSLNEDAIADYHKTLGEALVANGRSSEAEPEFLRALAIIEHTLPGLQSEADRLAWSRLQNQAYRDLFMLKLSLGHPDEAFAWWEWYRGASLRGTRPIADGTLTPDRAAIVALTGYRLPHEAAFISYVLLPNDPVAMVYRDGVVQVHHLQLPADIQALVLRYLRRCSDRDSNLQTLETESGRLYSLLLAPFEDELRGASRLQIETDGVLDQVPFDLLHRPGDPLIADRFEFGFSPGLAYAKPELQISTPFDGPALVVSAADTPEPGLPALPDAEQEAREVAGYFREARLVFGSQMPKADILQDLRDASVFHFAGHAFAGVNVVGLRLNPDSVLTPGDIASLGTHRLQLAVLSGCDTANGSDGAFTNVNSLARTLIGAGVPQVIASRWTVESGATRELMQVFYAKLATGQTPAASLHSAMAALRQNSMYQRPYYWASFAVFGSN